jgi:formylmethanofuran dehydrogenase subunit E
MNPKPRKCDRCEKLFTETNIVYDGGFYLCRPCKWYMDDNYTKLMAKEANEGKDK